MNPRTILIAAVIAVLAAGGYWFLNQRAAPDSVKTAEAPKAVPTTPLTKAATNPMLEEMAEQQAAQPKITFQGSMTTEDGQTIIGTISSTEPLEPKLRIPQQYAPFFVKLRFTLERQQTFLDLQMAKYKQWGNAEKALPPHFNQSDIDNLRQLDEQITQDTDAQLHQMLGDADYAAYHLFEDQLLERDGTVPIYGKMLEQASVPLTQVQTEALIDLLYQYRKSSESDPGKGMTSEQFFKQAATFMTQEQILALPTQLPAYSTPDSSTMQVNLPTRK